MPISFNKNDWLFPARLIRVVDGDTIEVWLDVGFNMQVKQICRLAGINAPEMGGDTRAAGVASRAALLDLLTSKPDLICSTVKDREKYGRFLCRVYVMGDDGQLVDVNQHMVDSGYAVIYNVN